MLRRSWPILTAPQHNGFMAYTSETRGAPKESCCPPAPSPPRRNWPKLTPSRKSSRRFCNRTHWKAKSANGTAGSTSRRSPKSACRGAVPRLHRLRMPKEREMRRCVSSSGRLASRLHRQPVARRIQRHDLVGPGVRVWRPKESAPVRPKHGRSLFKARADGGSTLLTAACW